MSYESPIKLITDLNYKLIEDQERNIVKAVCSYGIDISKDELFKLLYDDRKQYDKGFSDGYAKAKEDIVRCKDCKRYTPFRNIQGGEMGEGECEGYDPCVPANHYCSRGERKNG